MHVFIIAEAGVNHNGNLENAKRLVDAAIKAGCDAVKFQSFKADNLVTRFAPKAEYQERNTGTAETQYLMLKKLELSEEYHQELFQYCSKKKIMFISTPFDEESADMLEKLGMELYKIPSGEITNKPLLQHIAKKMKPIILSTGMSTLGEIEEALEWIYDKGNEKVTLLHCTSNYPTAMCEVNLKAMRTLLEAFKVKVGYSDHTEGIEIPIAAAALGAEVIEKHITLSKKMEGPDHKVSLEPSEFKKMVTGIRNIERALGNGIKKPVEEEFKTREVARKSIVTCCQITKGQTITKQMLALKRPGVGLQPKLLEQIVGRKAVRDLQESVFLSKDDFI